MPEISSILRHIAHLPALGSYAAYSAAHKIIEDNKQDIAASRQIMEAFFDVLPQLALKDTSGSTNIAQFRSIGTDNPDFNKAYGQAWLKAIPRLVREGGENGALIVSDCMQDFVKNIWRGKRQDQQAFMQELIAVSYDSMAQMMALSPYAGFKVLKHITPRIEAGRDVFAKHIEKHFEFMTGDYAGLVDRWIETRHTKPEGFNYFTGNYMNFTGSPLIKMAGELAHSKETALQKLFCRKAAEAFPVLVEKSPYLAAELARSAAWGPMPASDERMVLLDVIAGNLHALTAKNMECGWIVMKALRDISRDDKYMPAIYKEFAVSPYYREEKEQIFIVNAVKAGEEPIIFSGLHSGLASAFNAVVQETFSRHSAARLKYEDVNPNLKQMETAPSFASVEQVKAADRKPDRPSWIKVRKI